MMNKTIIIYWSGTGNTKIMAEKIYEGLEEADIKNVFEATVNDTLKYDKIILGSPSMGNEQLEEYEFLPFFEELLPHLKNKKVALFGSYGWGDGLWMRNWVNKLKRSKANLFEEQLTIYSTPSGDEEKLCIEFGKKLNNF